MNLLITSLFLVSLSLPVFADLDPGKVPQEDVDLIADRLDESADKAGSKAEEEKLRKVKLWVRMGRGLGKASSVVYTETARPFIATGSFFRGTFTKLDSVSATQKTKLMSFFLDNEKDLQQIYKDPRYYTELIESGESQGALHADLVQLVTNMFKRKILLAVKDLLSEINFNPSVNGVKLTDAQSVEELLQLLGSFDPKKNKMALLKVKALKLNNKTVEEVLERNGLAELSSYVDITPLYKIAFVALMGKREVSEEDYLSMVNMALVEDMKEFLENFIQPQDGRKISNQVLAEIIETSVALSGQFIIPSIACGVIVNGALGGTYAAIVGAAAVGTAVSVGICNNPKNADRLEDDEDFRRFCTYVVFRNSLKLLKSKSKGFLAGQKFRKNILGHIAQLKERSQRFKQCKADGKSRKVCRQELKEEKKNVIEACLSTGQTKRSCKKAYREGLRVEHKLN